MTIDLTDTTASDINAALTQGRHRMGGSTMGMVLTLVIVTDERDQYDALRAATQAGREHPCRVLVVIPRGSDGDGQARARLDAELHIGDSGPDEIVVLRLYGPLSEHADSVISPLLVLDTPVVTWWPGQPPRVPAEDRVGALAQRRITDLVPDTLPLVERAASYRPGDTDLAWTRLTPWRSLLASALDHPFGEVLDGAVAAATGSASAELLTAWLAERLRAPVEHNVSDGPGITAVRLRLRDDDGDKEIAVTRPDGRLATLSRTGWPDRRVALHRRTMSELLAEELRRMDPDEVYEQTLKYAAWRT